MLSAILACALGGVVVESASRGVYVGAGYPSHRDQAETTALGAWSSDLYIEYTDAWHSTGYPSWGRAVQGSVISGGESGLVSASGYLGGFDGTMFGGVGSGVGISIVSAVFSLDAPSQATFLVDALMEGTAANLSVSLRSTPVGGVEVDVFRYEWPVLDWDVSWAGELLPGRYTFYAFFSAGGGGAGTGGGDGEYEFELGLVPGPWTVGAAVVMVRRRRR